MIDQYELGNTFLTPEQRKELLSTGVQMSETFCLGSALSNNVLMDYVITVTAYDKRWLLDAYGNVWSEHRTIGVMDVGRMYLSEVARHTKNAKWTSPHGYFLPQIGVALTCEGTPAKFTELKQFRLELVQSADHSPISNVYGSRGDQKVTDAFLPSIKRRWAAQRTAFELRVKRQQV